MQFHIKYDMISSDTEKGVLFHIMAGGLYISM